MILLKPKILAINNRFNVMCKSPAAILRGVVVFLLTSVLVILTYLGTLWVLKQINSQPTYFYISPSMPLGAILVFLFYMLLFTNTISAIGCMYFSAELSLILSSPIQGAKFYFGKLFETLISSSWMTVVFALPVLFAFGAYYQASFSYYVFMCLFLLPYFLIPASIAMILASISIMLIPVRLRKEAMFITVCCFLYAVSYLLSSSATSLTPENGFNASDLVKIVQSFSSTNNSWFVPNLLALILGEILQPQYLNLRILVVMMILLSLGSLSFSYLFVSLLYEYCYFRANIVSNSKRATGNIGPMLSYLLSKFLSPKSYALVDKEIKVVTRDLTQSIQLLMLLGICALYLYSLSIQNFFIEKSPEHLIRWWKSFFLILNICVESFVITALSSRFAFSAVSREGRAFWIMQVAPIHIKDLLKSKFWVWFSFIYLVSVLVFGTASWIYFKDPQLLLFKVLGLIVVNLGLVSLAIGSGAYFARFDWEHLSQIATSFGNLVYMLLAVMLVMFDVLMQFLFLASIPTMGKASLVFLVLLLLLNFLVSSLALRLGSRKLQVFSGGS